MIDSKFSLDLVQCCCNLFTLRPSALQVYCVSTTHVSNICQIFRHKTNNGESVFVWKVNFCSDQRAGLIQSQSICQFVVFQASKAAVMTESWYGPSNSMTDWLTERANETAENPSHKQEVMTNCVIGDRTGAGKQRWSSSVLLLLYLDIQHNLVLLLNVGRMEIYSYTELKYQIMT